MKRIVFLMFVAGLALTISCSTQPQKSEPKPIAQGVKIQTATLASVDDYYEAVGTIQARDSSVVAARVMGNVIAVHIREGDTVRVGQLLIEIDNRDAGFQLQKSQAGLREAQNALEEVERSIHAAESARSAAQANERLASATLNRYQKLFERRSVSPQEFDEVRTKFEVARAESERADRGLQAIKARHNQALARIDQARADAANARVYVGYARITAPINGVVVAKQAEVGSMATPGLPLLSIESDSNYQLESTVAESQFGKIHLGDQARVRIDALGNKELTGSVAEITPAADPTSRSYIVKLALPQAAKGELRSGLYGKAQFLAGQRQALVIPQGAVFQRGQLVGVFVVDQAGLARLRLIKTGKTFGDNIEVLSGLNDGEQIVVSGLASIQDGTRVRDTEKIAAR